MANLRADWIAGELRAFLWPIVGLVLLITGFVTSAIMDVIGYFILSYLLHLRDPLNPAAMDPEYPEAIAKVGIRRDELDEVIEQFDSYCAKYLPHIVPHGSAWPPWSTTVLMTS